MTRDTIIDLIRHGEPEGGRMIRGQGVDHPLGALGWAQMCAAVGETLVHSRAPLSAPGSSPNPTLIPAGTSDDAPAPGPTAVTADWDQILSSPLARCREFALALASRRRLPLAVDPQLREIDMGAWEGHRPNDLAAQAPAAFTDYLRDPVRHRPPGGERLEAMVARVGAAYDRHVASYPGHHLLIVCHAGVSRALIGHLLGADPARWARLRIDYAGLTRIRHGRFGAAIEFVNAARLR